MILTPIARDQLAARLQRFASHLHDRRARTSLARIAATVPTRARGARAEAHRLAAAGLARRLGIRIRAGSPRRSFGWNGRTMRAGTEAYVLLHEAAHWLLADTRRRRVCEFGLGPGPETGHCAAALRAMLLPEMAREREEAMASLLGILWEAELRQPALASFLDQNWLEGWDRPGAARYFATVLARLAAVGLVDFAGHPMIPRRPQRRSAP
jgi:hypothetical protein